MPRVKFMDMLTPTHPAADPNTHLSRPLAAGADQSAPTALKKHGVYGHTSADIEQQISDWLATQSHQKQP